MKEIVDSGALSELEGSLSDLIQNLLYMDENKAHDLKIRFKEEKDGLNPGGHITITQCYEIYYEK